MNMEEKYRYVVTVLMVSENDKGKTVTSKEDWLINAVSVTDAETKANKEISKMTVNDRTFEYRVKDVKESRIVKVIE
jgi:hypothetical protein